jgi:hypothetical protein
MQDRDVEYCNFREIKAVVLTWNAGASTPGSVRTSDFIRDAVTPEDPPEILIFGFQELVDLENKKITASTSFPVSLPWKQLLTLLQRACSWAAKRKRTARRSI